MKAKSLQRIFEKLLPPRWWQRPAQVTNEQFWNAFASVENPQSKAVLHVAQNKFVSHMQSAANPQAPAEERLRALDRAMAIADFMTEVDDNFAVAKDVVARRQKPEEQK